MSAGLTFKEINSVKLTGGTGGTTEKDLPPQIILTQRQALITALKLHFLIHFSVVKNSTATQT